MGYRSAFEQPDHHTAFTFFPQQKPLLAGVSTSAEVIRLIKFADGYYTVGLGGKGLEINIMRFGQVGGWQYPNAPFVFRYQLGDETVNRLVVQRGRFEGWSQPVITAYINRIFNDDQNY